ncbi:hypothetical protein [Clostridium perfringens]|uniref:Uncharacterized protein n=2 Tax=Clostridium perfringens TaxID=1502 RepID=A0A8H9UXD2_CLOPF|nr:hypothetical protein [Clostridium perfringens]MDU7143156.1 hypothetical protein [Anaerococcus vaginalis]MDU7943372.1 hypothetical protein [Streptococcus salivarius]MDU7977660.1 hypothetical protein [Clostridioides difficile]EDT15847.1 hypothetical protein AC3_A0240 [Clostridium perfringens E str. JGS1987]EGS5729459.1 hypothetical protein [Clostridium perfringens]
MNCKEELTILNDLLINSFKNNENKFNSKLIEVREKFIYDFERFKRILPDFTLHIETKKSMSIDIPNSDLIAWLGDFFIVLDSNGNTHEIEYLDLSKYSIIKNVEGK